MKYIYYVLAKSAAIKINIVFEKEMNDCLIFKTMKITTNNGFTHELFPNKCNKGFRIYLFKNNLLKPAFVAQDTAL